MVEEKLNIFEHIPRLPPDFELVADGFVLASFLILGVLFAVIPLVLAYLFAPRDKSRGLGAIYECGMPAFGQARAARFGVFYYIFALIFIVFEVDVLYLFPVARIYRYGIGLVGFGFFLVYTIGTRSKYFSTLNIRVSNDGMCAFYHIKPENPYYVGPFSGISIKIITPGNTLPAGKGEESKNWADIEIKVPEKEYEFYHTGFSTKDISVLQSFLRKTGKWKKKTGKGK